MVALVTGAAVGIGRAIALALLAEGMDTWLADVQNPEGPEGRFVRLDVSDDTALRELIVRVQPDVLVNNAGGIPAGAPSWRSSTSISARPWWPRSSRWSTAPGRS